MVIKNWFKTGFGYFFLLSFFPNIFGGMRKGKKNNQFVVHSYTQNYLPSNHLSPARHGLLSKVPKIKIVVKLRILWKIGMQICLSSSRYLSINTAYLSINQCLCVCISIYQYIHICISIYQCIYICISIYQCAHI